MINIIKINLNQGESEEVLREKRREKIRWVVFGSLVFLFLLLDTGLLMINSKINGIISQKRDRIHSIREEIDMLQRKGKNISKQDILSLKQLESGRIFWAEKLMAMGNQIPEDMALTRLIYRDGRLLINGIARVYPGQKEFEVVDYLVRKLQMDEVFSSDFERIKFSNYSRVKVKNQDIVTFEIESSLKPAGSSGRKISRRNSFAGEFE